MKHGENLAMFESHATVTGARRAGAIAGIVVVLSIALSVGTARAGSSQHPEFPLLDDDSTHVLESGRPASTMRTCGACHDTDFIERHSFHADVGASKLHAPGTTGRPWELGAGYFGRWDPLTYRFLTPEGDRHVDLTTGSWVQALGQRHVGGGPAAGPGLGDEPNGVAPDSWDWGRSGAVEMNCFLCHLDNPDNASRIQALESGEFAWANSATLARSGVVARADGQWRWNPEAFDEHGNLDPDLAGVRDPGDGNCGQCHGRVGTDMTTPMALGDLTVGDWSTLTTGQVMSPQRLSDSGMNLANKRELTRSWDVHSERVVGCTSCHYALNNPIYFRESSATRPQHLIFDPRRLDLGEYLNRPLHQFAKGRSAQGRATPEFENTLRRCDSCHDHSTTHEWLPFAARHTTALSCESCHVPKLNAPALRSVDWTVLDTQGKPRLSYRGVTGASLSSDSLITGYEPVLLSRDDGEGGARLAPFNLITSWYWVHDDPPRPVPLRQLQDAWLEDGAHRDDALAIFDLNGDAVLEDAELRIDTDTKLAFVTARLSSLGLEGPRVVGEVQPYSINHNVATGEWSTRECLACHGQASRISKPMLLATRVPGGVMPALAVDTPATLDGALDTRADGALVYRPNTATQNLYVLGRDGNVQINRLGLLLLLGTLGGVGGHGTLRHLMSRRRQPARVETKTVYMFSVYERLWHWLQAILIIFLILTGIVIHNPDTLSVLSFRYTVQIHNVLGFILIANAALSLFYHLASGEIRQFLPEPHGFIDKGVQQALYYLRGVFKHAPHPFEKTPERKMNPLQQATYLVILNLLLPLQILTGILIWGAQEWPSIAQWVGGLALLAPVHTMAAWLFTCFLVMHVYLTTIGHTPTSSIRSMIVGWDEVETHSREER
jgi:thiosulfate reductase cytochrome b subunit